MSVNISQLNKHELKAYDTFVEFMGLLIALKPKELRNVVKRLLMMRMLTQEEIIPFYEYLGRIS